MAGDAAVQTVAECKDTTQDHQFDSQGIDPLIFLHSPERRNDRIPCSSSADERRWTCQCQGGGIRASGPRQVSLWCWRKSSARCRCTQTRSTKRQELSGSRSETRPERRAGVWRSFRENARSLGESFALGQNLQTTGAGDTWGKTPRHSGASWRITRQAREFRRTDVIVTMRCVLGRWIPVGGHTERMRTIQFRPPQWSGAYNSIIYTFLLYKCFWSTFFSDQVLRKIRAARVFICSQKNHSNYTANFFNGEKRFSVESPFGSKK